MFVKINGMYSVYCSIYLAAAAAADGDDNDGAFIYFRFTRKNVEDILVRTCVEFHS